MTHANTKRVLSLLLVLALAVGVLGVGVSAATAENVRHYNTYVCLGDSVAAGFGPDNLDYVGLKPVDFAYHSLVAEAVKAEDFYQLAHPGERIPELRYFLSERIAYDASLFMVSMDEETAEALKPRYIEAVKTADLITVNVGSNDVITYSLGKTLAAMNAEDNTPEYLKNYIEWAGGISNALKKIFETAQTMGKLPSVINAFVQGLTESMTEFRANWDALCEDIYALNPDVTLVAVGYFNPMPTLRMSDESAIAIGQGLDAVALLMNQYVRNNAKYASKYLFADVTGTECYDLPAMSDPTFFSAMLGNVHPTHEGHAFMAQQILAVLPDSTLPFRDVRTSDWFYNDVYYVWEHGIMNGMNATQFAPNAQTTRAQFATVLYRMEGSPDVSGLTCPFTDLKADWYRDAVVWAYNAGVVQGVSSTKFDPDANITREQMVTMLYRYSGETVAAGALTQFSDAARISGYARAAVTWATENGIVNGMDDGTFRPQGNATRAQLAAILHRYQTM